MKFDLPKNVIKLFNIFDGYEIYLVGGCVRDLIMKITPHDYDFTTNATPNEMKEIAEKNNIEILPTGEQYGTMTFKFENELYEVTTFRGEKNSIYSDGRRPDNVEFGVSLFEDLSRRDFTINAIAYNPEKGFIDPFDGKLDIKKKLIKAVGKADKRFQEDALRMLRALRFSSRFNFKIDKNTLEAIYKNYKLVSNVSKERIGSELVQIFNADYTGPCLFTLCEYIFDTEDPLFRKYDINFYSYNSVLSKIYYFANHLSEKELNEYAFGKNLVKGIIQLKKAQDYISNTELNHISESKYILDLCRTVDEKIAIFQVLDIEKEVSDVLITSIIKNDPITISELQIKGTDIEDIFKVKGKEVGNTLKICQRFIWKYPEYNKKDLLVKYLEKYFKKKKEN